MATEGWKVLNEALGESGDRVPLFKSSPDMSILRAIHGRRSGDDESVLGIMAAVSVLEALVVIGVGVAGVHGLSACDGR